MDIEIKIDGKVLLVAGILLVILGGGMAATDSIELASGYIDMSNNEIINLGMQDNPAPTDAVNVQYLEEQTAESTTQDLPTDSSSAISVPAGRP